MIELICFEPRSHMNDLKQLLTDYALSLNFNLCFQNFKKEMDDLPGDYATPSGRLLMAYSDGIPAGCIALRKIDNETSEMKRLYVRPEFRKLHIGRLLAERIIDEAKIIGYKRIRLDTVPDMEIAQKLYLSMGFKQINPYRENPIPGAIFMEKELTI